jgi:hypothetical protein
LYIYAILKAFHAYMHPVKGMEHGILCMQYTFYIIYNVLIRSVLVDFPF